MTDFPENYRRLEAALKPPETYRDPAEWYRQRIHGAVSDPARDIPLKELARRTAEDAVVRCPCGCRQSFPAKVQG